MNRIQNILWQLRHNTYSVRNSRFGNGSGLIVIGGGFLPFGFPVLIVLTFSAFNSLSDLDL